MIKAIIAALGLGALGIVGILLAFALGVAIGLVILAIPTLALWLLFNHAICPAFGWPPFKFWVVYACVLAVSIVSGLFRK